MGTDRCRTRSRIASPSSRTVVRWPRTRGNPPPPGAARAVCPEAPQGVLSLSRMVAVEKQDRRLKHISKPLRRQMHHLLDRTRWPVLVTYSDEGLGHNGFVYQCSGFTATTRSRCPVSVDASGARRSSYSSGKHGGRALTRSGFTWCQRWEARVCAPGDALVWMTSHGWRRMLLPGRFWASGRQAYTYVRDPDADASAEVSATDTILDVRL